MTLAVGAGTIRGGGGGGGAATTGVVTAGGGGGDGGAAGGGGGGGAAIGERSVGSGPVGPRNAGASGCCGDGDADGVTTVAAGGGAGSCGGAVWVSFCAGGVSTTGSAMADGAAITAVAAITTGDLRRNFIGAGVSFQFLSTRAG